VGSKTTEAATWPTSFGRNNTGYRGFRCTPAGDNSSRTEQKLAQLLGQAELRPRKKGGKQFMPLLQLVMVLIVVGVLLWLVNNFIPMQRTIKSILNAIVVIGVVLWLLNVFGLFHSFSNIRIGS
jgi:hypothetical protein